MKNIKDLVEFFKKNISNYNYNNYNEVLNYLFDYVKDIKKIILLLNNKINSLEEDITDITQDDEEDIIESVTSDINNILEKIKFKKEVTKNDLLKAWMFKVLKKWGKIKCYNLLNYYENDDDDDNSSNNFHYEFSGQFIDYDFLYNFFINDIESIDMYIDINEDCIDENGEIKYEIPDFIKKVAISNNSKIKKISKLPKNLDSLIIYNTNLETLENCSKFVRTFFCEKNDYIKNLIGSPEKVEIFYCNENGIETLEGCPKTTKYFCCGFNEYLENLNYLPNVEGLSIDISENENISMYDIMDYVNDNKIISKINFIYYIEDYYKYK